MSDHKVIQAMKQHGGGFVRALAAAAEVADAANRILIKQTWPGVWDHYSKMAVNNPN